MGAESLSGAGGRVTVGFVGLGLMGDPMARNLLRAGTPLVVWNRTPARAAALRAAGASVAPDPAALFRVADVVILMLADGAAIDVVLGRGSERFAATVAGRTVVHMGTTPPAYSAGLRDDVHAVGGRYVEAPVSGSAVPARAGELIAMLAGDDDAVEAVTPLLTPMCRRTVRCGAVPNATVMKLAVNVFLVTMVAGLAEAAQFAQCHGLDSDSFRAVLDAGPMASDVSRVKLAKMLDAEFSPQAALADVLKNCQLVATAAADAALVSPVLAASHDLYAESVALGHGGLDMAAVLSTLRARTEAARVPGAASATP
jgi:3-hydroxyisobutyrate dehydrogenase